MISALRAGWRGLRHLNHRGYQYIWANVLWLVLTLPIITAPAAWAGLARMSYFAYRSPTISLDDFWQGFRENLKRSAGLALVNVAVIVVNLGNLAAYREAVGFLPELFRTLWLFSVVFWFGAQFYMWPLYYAMKQPSLRGALRNAAVMMLLNPLFTLTLWAFAALIMALSTALPAAWLLLTGSALVSVANSAVLDRLQAAGLIGGMPPEADMSREEAV